MSCFENIEHALVEFYYIPQSKSHPEKQETEPGWYFRVSSRSPYSRTGEWIVPETGPFEGQKELFAELSSFFFFVYDRKHLLLS